MVAEVEALVPALQRLDGEHQLPGHPHLVKPPHGRLVAGAVRGRPVVEEHPHRDAAPDRGLEGVEERRRGLVEGEDVELHVDVRRGSRDLLRHRCKRVGVVGNEPGLVPATMGVAVRFSVSFTTGSSHTGHFSCSAGAGSRRDSRSITASISCCLRRRFTGSCGLPMSRNRMTPITGMKKTASSQAIAAVGNLLRGMITSATSRMVRSMSTTSAPAPRTVSTPLTVGSAAGRACRALLRETWKRPMVPRTRPGGIAPNR